jgi:hypothetical protein
MNPAFILLLVAATPAPAMVEVGVAPYEKN